MYRKNKNRRILIALAAVAVLLIILFAVAMTQSARIRAALEEARDRLEANKTPTTTAPPRAPLPGYLSLKNRAIGAMKLFYYGDDTVYGRGSGTMPADPANEGAGQGAYSMLLHKAIAEAYNGGASIGGRITTYTKEPHTTEVLTNDFLNNYFYYGMDFRLAILSPSDRILEKNAEVKAKDGYVGTLTGDAGKDIEDMIRTIRESAPYCDILLAIPYDASASLADTLLALGGHYGLVVADLRPIGATDGMVHTEGEDIGFPTAQGHRAIADAILAAIAEAVDAGHKSIDIPSTKLY